MRDHTPTYEKLSTLLCQIEACFNLRSLYPLSVHSEDLEALTLDHFLIGEVPIIIRSLPLWTFPPRKSIYDGNSFLICVIISDTDGRGKISTISSK